MISLSPSSYDAIYLSPHLDDAALSCGGQIFQRTRRGESVLMVTVAAGDPPDTPLSAFARSLHDRWQLSTDVVNQRRQEDKRACQILGADYRHLPLTDCIYRVHPETGKPLYTSEEDLFGSVAEAEAELITKLARRMDQLPPADLIVAPLAVGHHVDHQLTRAAAEGCFGDRLWYYEDYPYVGDEGALAAVLPADRQGWQAKTIALDDAALAGKIEAIMAYASQISTFWRGRTELEAKVRGYAQQVGGERLWQKV